MMKLFVVSSLVLTVLFTPQTFSPAAQAQAPSAAGRWEIQFSLEDGVPHKVQFDADTTGKGTFLLLDTRSNLVPPATPADASWSQSDPNQVKASGAVEFPIGNVGRDPGKLNLTGTFNSPDVFSGSAVFVSDLNNRPDRKGSFTAIRAGAKPAVMVRMLSFNDGGKARRGKEVTIEWDASGIERIASIDLLLSVDNGESFSPIATHLGADSKSFVWAVPSNMSQVKRALLKIVVAGEKGSTAEDVSDSTFKIK